MNCMSCGKLIVPLKARIWKEEEIEYPLCYKCYKEKKKLKGG